LHKNGKEFGLETYFGIIIRENCLGYSLKTVVQYGVSVSLFVAYCGAFLRYLSCTLELRPSFRLAHLLFQFYYSHVITCASYAGDTRLESCTGYQFCRLKCCLMFNPSKIYHHHHHHHGEELRAYTLKLNFLLEITGSVHFQHRAI
jgi:hypothetical protein